MQIEELCENVYIDLNPRVTAVHIDEWDLRLSFETDCWKEDRRRHFLISCQSVFESALHFEPPYPIEGIAYVTDDPLLWKHNQNHAYLHFTSAPKNPHEVIGRLYLAHESTMEWHPLKEYLNQAYIGKLDELLQGGRGMLAFGPESLIDAYEAEIGSLMSTNRNPAQKKADGGAVGLILDDFYVVAKSIAVQEVEKGKA